MKRLDLTGLPVFADLDAPDPELDEIESRQYTPSNSVSKHGILADMLKTADAFAKQQQETRKEHRMNLSKALTGVPHGPYVKPSFSQGTKPIRPGTFIGDSGAIYPYEVMYKGEKHRQTGHVKVPAHEVRDMQGNLKSVTPILNGRNANRYMEAYRAYMQALNDYDNGEGPQWESYNKKYAEYERKLGAYNARINKRDTAREDRENKKRIAANRKAAKQAFTNSQDWNGVNYAGYAPWSDKYGEFKRLKSKEYKDIGASYRVMKHPPKKTVTLSNGRRVRVIDGDLGVPLGFSQMFGYNGASEVSTDEKTGLTSADYVEEAFSGRHKTHDWEGDCGHIVGVHYSAYYQLLQINFRSGDTCTYFRVPSTVAGELLTFARNGALMHSTVDGTDRHALGIRFWDLVRIRGTKHGSRYRFEYGNGGSMSSYQRKWAYVPAKDFGHHSVSKLAAWKEQFEKENGRPPNPTEFASKAAELRSSGAEKDTYDSSHWADQLLDAAVGDGSSMTGYKRVKQGVDQVSVDTLDEYFEHEYNQDLALKKVDSKKLQKAYDMYMNGMDTDDIVNVIRSSGAFISDR